MHQRLDRIKTTTAKSVSLMQIDEMEKYEDGLKNKKKSENSKIEKTGNIDSVSEMFKSGKLKTNGS